MGTKFYCEETDAFTATEESKAKYFDTYSDASKKQKKLYKKIFGNISIKVAHEK